jgi:hypothetical protein
MNIAFFSEIGQSTGIKFPSDYNNMRTDVAWAVALNATVYSFSPIEFPDIDLGIMICPKKSPEKCFQFFERFKGKCLFANIQEGPQYGFQDYDMVDQIKYLRLLNEMDIIFCHNEQDKLYFEGLFPDQQVETFPSLLIEGSLPRIPHEDRVGSMISGNMSSWYGGMDSFIVGQILSPGEVYAPSMGRRIANEEQLEGLTHLPYMNWQSWFLELNKRKYGVNLMRTFAAGSFSLACARLKIPCIGWGRVNENNPEGCDTMRFLFPELTIPTGNMKAASLTANHLKENQLFYDHCAEYAFAKYNEIYREEIFINKFNEIIKNLK